MRHHPFCVKHIFYDLFSIFVFFKHCNRFRQVHKNREQMQANYIYRDKSTPVSNSK